jgi:hypothetical protein
MLAQNRSFQPNVKPVASAGRDITISSASGSAYLDAGASRDPDGKVMRYIWEKISGPAVGSMSGEVTAKPLVSGLNFPGVYVFGVRVVDDRAEWSVATVKVTVVDGNVLN